MIIIIIGTRVIGKQVRGGFGSGAIFDSERKVGFLCVKYRLPFLLAHCKGDVLLLVSSDFLLNHDWRSLHVVNYHW